MRRLKLKLKLGRKRRRTGGGGNGNGAALDDLLATYTLDLNPVEANITKDGADLVSALAETGTVGASWVQASDPAKPLWVADGGNGKPALVFQDTGDALARSGSTPHNTYFTTTESFLFAVIETDSIAAGTQGVIECAIAGGAPRLAIRRVTANMQGFHFDGTSDGALGAISATTRTIVAIRHLAGNVGISINGGAWVETVSGNTASPTTSAPWSIGFHSAIINANPGKVWRIAGNSAYPGDTDYAALVALLASVYGVTV